MTTCIQKTSISLRIKNGNLQRRETTHPEGYTSEELYRFGADGNLRLYSYDRLFYSLYGYDGGTTRTYKYSFDLNPQWVNGRLEAVNFNLHNAMFYPNAYINFNNNGYYTKHYYNGMERIASRLGDNNLSLATHDPELQDRKDWQDSLIRKNIVEITGYEFLEPGQEQDPDDPKPVFELPQVEITGLQPIGSGDVFYYHPNHLGSTCYVTDGNASVQQGFLYAPFGEITNEHNVGWQSGTLPKYSFNAKELDEETGMYYYEARYYAPPTFVSRDPLFEKYPTFSPYSYCVNNPVNVIDPTGMEGVVVSGGEYDDKNRYKYNFIEPAITKLKELKAAGGSEPITWIVATAGYSESDLASFKKIADELGVGFQTISSADEFTNYLNSKDVNTTNLSDARKNDKITSMSIFGHGYAGSVEFAHGQDNHKAFSWGTDKVNLLEAGAFNNANVDFYTCNSATNIDETEHSSLCYVFCKRTGSSATGYRGQSTYSKINIGQGISAKWNRHKNGFNTKGSVFLPRAGKDAKKVTFINKTKKK